MPQNNGERLPPVQDGAERVDYRSAGGSSVGQRAHERVRQKAARMAAAVRDERVANKTRHLLKGEGGSPRAASEAELQQIAEMLNRRMVEVFMDPQARSWYKLFCHMDDDGSGKVDFYELEDMIRNELKVSDSKLSSDQLSSVWRALDQDSSGLITAGEFGHFMRLGSHVHSAEESSKSKILRKKEADGIAFRQEYKEMVSSWRDAVKLAEVAVIEHTSQLRKGEAGRVAAAVARVKQQKGASAQAVRQEREARLTAHLLDTAGAPPRAATSNECHDFSLMLNKRMIDLFLDPGARSWYKLFVHMDDDGSGKITFREFEELTRDKLKVSTSKVSDEQIRSIWVALDSDKSGFITAGEFGKFMRLGGHVHEASGEWKTKIMETKKSEGAATRQEKEAWQEERKQKYQEDELAKRARAAEQHDVAWGVRPGHAKASWRSPNALVFQ
jgi:Ca2+-binding EF-hand superfamily protein